jgi:hypothetical protein
MASSAGARALTNPPVDNPLVIIPVGGGGRGRARAIPPVVNPPVIIRLAARRGPLLQLAAGAPLPLAFLLARARRAVAAHTLHCSQLHAPLCEHAPLCSRQTRAAPPPVIVIVIDIIVIA